MKQNLIFISALLLIPITSFGQEIGENAVKVKQLAELETRSRSNASYNVKYYDGKISDVIVCYNQQYIADYRVVSNLCRHYTMEYEKLAYVLTQYENISVSTIKKYYDDRPNEYIKIGDLYYSDDYENCYKIYLHQNGLATVKSGPVKPSDLPQNVRFEIKRKQDEKNKAEKERIFAEQKEKEREAKIKSEVYDLEQYAPDEYKRMFNRQRDEIIVYFTGPSNFYRNINFPSFSDLDQRAVKFERFKNTYTVYYELKGYSRPNVNNGYYIVAGSRDIKNIQQVKLEDGTDQDCSLLKSTSIELPTIEIEGYEVMTKVKFENIKVDFTRGYTKIKIIKGEIEFIKFPPEQDLQHQIINELKNQPNGKYTVTYEIGHILDKNISNIKAY